ncbi:hypothetical protein [Streptomyces coeruleorubidus]|uniref:hypothetical protein n=1 Tax=Streptomyces coeruleorubidus TaxID=116188 RepID=UPI00123CB428|nr:hypothetical protein [Streptomyces coeruleorubidus]
MHHGVACDHRHYQLGHVRLAHVDGGRDEPCVGLVSFLLYLVGAGIIFAIGYFTVRQVFDLSEQRSLVVGAALPVVYGASRLIWLKLGLPTPHSDYDRWRRQDHRDYWS